MSIVPSSKRPDEFPMVDSENTLTDFSTLQQQLLRVSTNNNNNIESNTNESSIICVEKTTTHHSFYDVEKLAGDTNSPSLVSARPSSSRLLGMGNPAIIGKKL